MNVFKQLFLSLFSPKDIAGFRNQGIGKTSLFIFILALVSIIPSAYYIGTMISDGVQTIEETVTTELPDFQINNGQLSVDSPEPVVVEKNGLLLYLDDSGQMTSDALAKESDTAIGLLKNELVFVVNGQAETSSYSVMEGMSLSKEEIMTLLDSVDSILIIIIPTIILFIYIFTAASLFLKITIFAIFGLLIKNSLGRLLSYRQLWIITAYSVTLPTLFFTIMAAFQTIVPFGTLINWFVTSIMMYLSIKEVSETKNNLPE
jgi:Protein of unknown function (DUF1189)